ncbi:MAG: hypothetical protein H6970_12340 [Gammaproteobacteria bacterium]|nr:hypothetical protein [Gammaproteobacteria bacterium]MCP5425837.1 hypothetical protein [Gammaproteobacteria bacterium]MCP5458553.1 hypothetical protein [Gammaproteobacteria bacterium]
MNGDVAGWPLARLARLILYHKHPISARTHFLQFQDGGICAFESLPKSARILERGCCSTVVVVHPKPLLAQAERWIRLPPGSLVREGGFQEHVAAADEILSIYLARIEMMDPPLTAAAWLGCRFVPLTETRQVVAAERELLRRAYQIIMEG